MEVSTAVAIFLPFRRHLLTHSIDIVAAVAMASTVQAHDWRQPARLYQRGVDASPPLPPCLPGRGVFALVGVPRYDQHNGNHTLRFTVDVRAGSNGKRWKTIRWQYPQVYESKRAATSWTEVVLAVLTAKQHNGAAAAIPVLGTALPGPTKRRKGVVVRRAAKRRCYEGQNIGRAEHSSRAWHLK